MFKRIGLFILTNLLVMVTISIVLNLLGVRPYLTASGIDYYNLMLFCLVWGMGGSFISLQMSRWMAKTMMDVQVIEPGRGGAYEDLVQMVGHLSKAAGLPKTPEVGVYESPDVNAFATGPSKNRALVAFSSGLLARMNRDEIEGVAAHEIAHIANGDMVTMTLLQGVVNAFVMFFSRIIAYAASQGVKEENRHLVNSLVTIVLDIMLGILGSLVVLWFSRQREFRADAGAARYAGREKMIAALQRISQSIRHTAATHEPASFAALKISGHSSSWGRLFMSHPPLEERIAALQR